jgi:serine/threonine protein kinase
VIINCPKCNHENPADSEFCNKCGAKLIPSEGMPIYTKTLQTPVRATIEDVDIGEIIDGKYMILEEIGRGGMGVVYKAEQKEPIRRTVAIKVIKLGMDTKEVVARFDNEKQALAVMRHPNIAKVLDAGATKRGRPYFVMEFVPGIPITDYCDSHRLTIQERLELFIPVCEAVQHAHQKGIIHRDLKPSNVLVEIQDDKLVSKIIDFGIARATEHRLTERTLFTERGQLIGTPEYMSPEQAEMSGLDVDTRTDIYSLGVMLYELLAGVLPFDSKALRSAGYSEIQRIIREEEPPKASTRLRGLADTQGSIAEKRRTDVASLHKQLKGDLEWITMKAMDKDRARRYSTASDLANDLSRHLRSEPIVARPPSNIYNIERFVKRHKMGVAAAVVVVFALVIGVAGLTIGLEEAVKAKNEALQQAAKVEAINEFLNSMLSSPDPSKDGREVKVIDILDNAREKIGESFNNKQEIEASIRYTLGSTYEAIGVYEKSVAELKEALSIQKKILGSDHPDTLNTMNSLAAVFIRLGRFAEAESLLQETVSRQKLVLGAENEETVISMHNLGIVYYYQGKFEEAESIGRETLEIRKRVLGEDHPHIISSLENLAVALSGQKKHVEAEKVYIEAKEKALRNFGSNHPIMLRIIHNYACELNHLKKYQESESLFLETLERQKDVFGPDHPDTIITMANLADLLNNMERYVEAETLSREALEKEKRVFGSDHPLTKFTQEVLEKALKGSGRK